MAELDTPYDVFVSGGEIYIADTNNHRVRKVLRNGQITTIAGTGTPGYNGDGQLATDAQLKCPYSVVVSSSDQVYILDGCRIRKIDRNGIISTIAGNGKRGYSGFFITDDEELLIADDYNHRVRKVDRNRIISTIAGTGAKGYNGDDQLATSASLCYPTRVFQ